MGSTSNEKGVGDVFMHRVSALYSSLHFYRMASSGSCELQDSLSCGVCFEPYDSSSHLPKMLLCQHTFCNSCIERLINESNLYSDTFECPVCRTQISSDEVRINLAVKDIVEAALTKEKAKQFCPKHPAKECQIICTDCLQFLCGVCTIKGDHVGHTVDDIDEAKDTMKIRLTTAVETKIANLVKATSTKVDKMKKELAQQEEDINTRLNTVIYMITKALNEWKQTQLQKIQQTIDRELETSEALQESWRKKLQLSDLQSIVTGCKEAESKETEVEALSFDVSLRKINLDELQSTLSSLCDTIKTLLKDSEMQPSLQASSSPRDLTAEDTDKNPICWDFIVQLCSCAVPQKDHRTYPYIPQCVKRVANMYNRNRNLQFHRVVHFKQERRDKLLCKTDDFLFGYSFKENQNHLVEGLWEPSLGKLVEFVEKEKDVLHDREYATKIKNALNEFERALDCYIRNGRTEIYWEIRK